MVYGVVRKKNFLSLYILKKITLSKSISQSRRPLPTPRNRRVDLNQSKNLAMQGHSLIKAATPSG